MENLRLAMSMRKISVRALADLLSITEQTLQNKLEMRTEFTLTETVKIRRIFPEYNADWLFSVII